MTATISWMQKYLIVKVIARIPRKSMAIPFGHIRSDDTIVVLSDPSI